VKKISIIIDHPQRDLAGYVYLAEELAKKNFKVFLVPMYNFHEIFLINPDLVILNHARKGQLFSSGIDLIIDYCRKSNISVVVLDSEGGLIGKSKLHLYKKNINESANEVDRYFLWGINKKRLVNKKKIKKFFVVGHPKFDLFFLKNYNNLYLEKFNKKNYILVNTSFSQLNPIEGDIHSKKNVENFKKSKNYDLKKINFNQLINFLKIYAKLNKNIEFILRPHPFESLTFYKKEFADYSNIKVINAGDIFFYIKNSKFVINHNCQTSLEAILANKNCINFSNKKILDEEDSVLKKISTNVENVNDLEIAVNKFLTLDHINNLNKKKKIVSKYYNNINKLSCPLVVENILFLSKHKNNKSSPNFFKIIGIYYKKRSFFHIIKFLSKIFFGVNIFFKFREFFGNQLYKRKFFDIRNVLVLVRFSEKNRLIIKRSSILDLHYKSLLFPQSIVIKKNVNF
jgi:surface carbohydrate biosynthesis protein